MTYWQENYAFIKDVYDSRSSKLEELMEKTDNAISAVLADKIYTSNEFKKIQEAFMVNYLQRHEYVYCVYFMMLKNVLAFIIFNRDWQETWNNPRQKNGLRLQKIH